MIQVFKNSSVELYYYPDLKVSRINYLGIVDMEAILEAFKFMMKNSGKTDSVAVIEDMTKLRGTFTMLIDYMKDNVFTFMENKGIKYNALIINDDSFIKFSTKKLIENIKNVEIKAFENEIDAIDWIVEQTTPKK